MADLHHLKITGDAYATVELDGRPLRCTKLTVTLDANADDPIPRATIEVPVSIDMDGGVVTAIGGGVFYGIPAKPAPPQPGVPTMDLLER